ncbi:MAG TPA: diacylglycerol kinase family protein [Acidisarcina sp.]
MRKVALFVNPLLTRNPHHRATVTAVAAVLRGAGFEVAITELGEVPAAAGLARKAIDDGCERVFSCGGDGTVFALLQALAGTGVPLGIIPMGTGNVLAQNMRLPRDAVRAARMLIRSPAREVPLGRVSSTCEADGVTSSWYFAMSAGVGAHALLMQAAQRWGKHSSGRAAYYLAGGELLLRHRIEHFEIEITTTQGSVFTQSVSEALVVRVAQLNRWRPGGALDQPALRLAVVAAKTRVQMARASLRALLVPASVQVNSGPAPLSSTHVSYFDVSRIVCRPLPGRDYCAPPPLQADGEVLASTAAVITLAEKRLTLLWPDEAT